MTKEIVIVMGYNAAGKTTITERYEKDGYARFNRDTLGGKLAGVAAAAAGALESGTEKVVLDNTYATVEQRAEVVKVGKRLKIPVKCVHLTTSLEDAQLNACLRMMHRIGKIVDTEELKEIDDPNLFPPAAIFNYKKRFEKPAMTEGFSEIEVVKFERWYPPNWTKKALFVDYDQTLRDSTGDYPYPIHPREVKVLPGRKEKLREYEQEGYYIFGVSNQSGIAKGILTKMEADACFRKTNELLDQDISYRYCPHNIPPVRCYCRKPHPGMGAYYIHTYKLDPRQCIMVGDQTTDKTFAKRCGFKYFDQGDFFS